MDRLAIIALILCLGTVQGHESSLLHAKDGGEWDWIVEEHHQLLQGPDFIDDPVSPISQKCLDDYASFVAGQEGIALLEQEQNLWAHKSKLIRVDAFAISN